MRLGLFLASVLALVPMPASAALSERELAQAVATPPAGARLPALTFSDARGHTAKLETLADGTPLALIFADYTCRNVCSPGLTLTAARLRETGLVPGKAFRLVVIGIDPKDTRADALHFGQAIGSMPEVARATRFLRGDAATVTAATRALGYGHVYDPAADQYAHDASVYVFGADGRLIALLPQIGLLAEPLKAALTGNYPARRSDWITRVARVCYGFAAAHGRFGRPILLGLQGLAVLLLLCAAVLAFRLWRVTR